MTGWLSWPKALTFLATLIVLIIQHDEVSAAEERRALRHSHENKNDLHIEQTKKKPHLRRLKGKGKGGGSSYVGYQYYNGGYPYYNGGYNYNNIAPAYPGWNTITSYFEVGFTTRFGSPQDIDIAAYALAQVYNRLKGQYDDPLYRQIYQVDVVSTTIVDPYYNNGGYYYGGYQSSPQMLTIVAKFAVNGPCYDCGNDATFICEDTRGGRRMMEDEDNKEPEEQQRRRTESGDFTLPFLYVGCPNLPELIYEYSLEIQSLNLPNLVNVLFMEELDTEQAGYRGSSKGSKKGKGKKGMSKKGMSKKGMSKKGMSKKGKKHGGYNKSKKGSGYMSKNGYYYPPPPPYYHKSSKSKGADAYVIKCDTYDSTGPLEDIESFFEVEYATLTGTDEGVEPAAQALITAYNTVAQNFATNVVMETVEVLRSEAITDGQLQPSDEDDRRLQQFPPIITYLTATGMCNGCGGFTTGFQVSNNRPNDNPNNNPNNRKLQSLGEYGYYGYYGHGSKSSKSSKGKGGHYYYKEPCLKPGLPTEEEVLEVYSEIVQQMKIENIIDVNDLDEIPFVPTEAPTPHPVKYYPKEGKGKGGSKGSTRSTGSNRSTGSEGFSGSSKNYRDAP